MAGALVVARLDVERAGLVPRRLFDRHVEAAAENRHQRGDHVFGLGHHDRALFEQPVGALGARIQRRAGHREHFAPLFAGKPRRDQRARAARRFHNHHAGG
jgi:uncharacterized protein YceH (UPF0502 family)